MKQPLDSGVPSPRDFLARATERVIRAYVKEPPLTPDEGLLRAELSAVAEAVRMATGGRTPSQAGVVRLDRLRLVRMLRAAVLQHWSDDDGSLLATMLAFEATERVLSERAEQAAGTDMLAPFSRNVLREVSHLLRSPLGSIVMLTETLREERSGPLSEAQRRKLNIIYRAALSAAATAGDLLTLTSPEEHFGSARRFSVAEMVEAIADMVRPVTEARSSELIVRKNVERHRLGPASALGEALLGLALRVALMTREGRVELEASSGEGDFVAFSVTGHGAGAIPEGDTGDPLRIFRMDPDSHSYTISPEGLAFSAAREILRSIGSELHVAASPEGRLTLLFRIALPPAD